MNIKEAREELCRAVKAYTARDASGLYRIPQARRRPILLMGAPGIGKTAIAAQAAARCHVAFLSYTMTHHTRQSAVGLPMIREYSFQGKPYSMTEYTMSEIIGSVLRVIEETGMEEGLLFLDEINCVSETLLPSMLQLLQYKTFGAHRLPEGWVIAAAGNPPLYNRSARELDMVTLDRVKYIEISPDFPAWREYAAGRRIHSSILSYLTLKPEHLYVFRRGEGGRQFVTPRGWEDLSETLLAYEELGLSVEDSLFCQYIRCEDVSRDFSAFYRLADSLSRRFPLDALALRGERPSWSPDASLPGDERLCLAEQLCESLTGQLSSWEADRSLFSSLSYFMDGLRASLSEKSPSAVESACRALLEKRGASLAARKPFGLLSEKEERLEESLKNTVLSLLAFSRPEAEKQGTDCLSLMEERLKEQAARLEPEALRLEKALKASLDFLLEAFGDGLELSVFACGLLEAPESASFLSLRLPQLSARLKELAGL